MSLHSQNSPFVNEHRLGADGTGLHPLYYLNYANACAKPDPFKRSRIMTSQSVGAWVKSDQFKHIYTDTFQATAALSPVKCTWRDYTCVYDPTKSHFIPDALSYVEDYNRAETSPADQLEQAVPRDLKPIQK
jgi:hypothetical protein